METCSEELTVNIISVEDAIPDLQLMRLAQDIGPESWRLVGLGLGFKEPELARMERENKLNMVECTYQMLVRWRHNECDSTIALGHLSTALIDAKLGSVALQLNRGSTCHLDSVYDGENLLSPGKVLGMDVRQLRRELEMHYNSHLGTTRLLPWDPRSRVAINRYFVDSGIVLEDTSVRNRTKIPLEKHRHDIFTFSAKKNLPANRILLQGKPGSGKSTLVAKIALDWVSQHPKSALRDIPLLFSLPLQKLNEKSNLGEAIRQLLLPEDSVFTADAIESFIRSRPQDATVILDGLDELSKGDLKGEKVGNLVKLIENKRFMECRVMITSRPRRVADMKESILREYTLLEIEGLKVEDIFDYVITYFQEDLSMAQGLIRHLEASPTILETLCPYPLFCSIVCHLWEKDIGKCGGDRLGTHSELTDFVIKSLWTHHESKYSEEEIENGFDRPRFNSVHELRSRMSMFFSSFRSMNIRRKRSYEGGFVRGLPTHSFKATLCKIGKIALGKLIAADVDLGFQPKDQDFSRDYTDIGLAVGILSKEQTVRNNTRIINSRSKDDTCVRFIHLGIMQKCAAVYLAFLWKKNHAKFADTLKQLNDKFVVEQFQEILMLACGEDSHVAKEILYHLSSVSASHDLILKCYFESPEDKSVNEEMMRIFKDKYYVALSSPTSHTLLALKYFLGNTVKEENMDSVINKLFISAAPPASMPSLIDVLDEEHCPNVLSMSLSWCDLENANTPALLYALGRLPRLSDLTMTGSTIGPTFIENIGRLPEGCFSCLSTLELPIGLACADAVLKSTFWSGQFTALQRVFVTLLDSCSDSTPHPPHEQDHSHPPPLELRKISINCSNFSLHASCRFAQTLNKALNLTKLAIVSSKLHAQFFTQLEELSSARKILLHMESWKDFQLESFLNKCPNLTHVEVNTTSSGRHDEIKKTLDVISKVMPRLPLLNTIHVSVGLGCAYSAGEDTVDMICQSLRQCRKLNRVVMTGIKITVPQSMNIVNTCRQGSVRVICLTGCFTLAQDLTELRRLRHELNQEKSIVLEF